MRSRSQTVSKCAPTKAAGAGLLVVDPDDEDAAGRAVGEARRLARQGSGGWTVTGRDRDAAYRVGPPCRSLP